MNQTTQPYVPFAQNIAIVKSYFKKPTVLVQSILYIASALLSIVTVIVMSNWINNFFDTIMRFPELTAGMTIDEFDMFTTIMNVYTTILPIVSIIPAVIVASLFATAFMLLYFKSKNPNLSSNPKSGATILFVLSILQLIPIAFVCLMFVIALVLLIILSALAEVPAIISIIYAVIFILSGGIMLMYAISQLNYYNSIRKSLSSVNLTYKGAGLYGVLTMIYGVYCALSALSSLFFVPLSSFLLEELKAEMYYDEAILFDQLFGTVSPLITVSVVASFVATASLIIEAIIALGYKKHIKSYTDGYATPYIQTEAPVQPFVPPVTATEQTAIPFAEQPAPPVENNVPTSFNPQTIICPRCTKENSTTCMFCEGCGFKLK